MRTKNRLLELFLELHNVEVFLFEPFDRRAVYVPAKLIGLLETRMLASGSVAIHLLVLVWSIAVGIQGWQGACMTDRYHGASLLRFVSFVLAAALDGALMSKMADPRIVAHGLGGVATSV